MIVTLAALLLMAPDLEGPSKAEPKDAGGASATAERVRCKYFTDTGSRLKRSRVCMTNRDWDAQQRANAHDLQRGAEIVGGNKD